jgi:hypothetical protein
LRCLNFCCDLKITKQLKLMLLVNLKLLIYKLVCGLSSYIVESIIYLVLEALFQVTVMWMFSVSLFVLAEFLVCFIIIIKDLTIMVFLL